MMAFNMNFRRPVGVGAGSATAPPDFFRLVNPMSIRGPIMPTTLQLARPDFQTYSPVLNYDGKCYL